MSLLEIRPTLDPFSISSLHFVVNERGERRLANSEMLELHKSGEAIEKTLPGTEHQWGDDQRELIEESGGQGLPDYLSTAHHVHLSVTRCRPGPLDRLG
jgi:hypothetical protein